MAGVAAQLPAWVEWAKALGPVFVSALAVFVSLLTFRLGLQIARWQQSVSRAQIRQNVYDRRFRIYESAKGLFVTFQNNGSLSADDYLTYLRGISDAVFLLDASIVAYLEEIREKTLQSIRLRNKIQATIGTGAPKYHEWVDEFAAVDQWFLCQFDVLIDKFKPSMQLDDP